MLLKALPDDRLEELARLHLQMAMLRRDRHLQASTERLCRAALMTQLVLAKASLGLYQNQTSPEAVQAELQRRHPA